MSYSYITRSHKICWPKILFHLGTFFQKTVFYFLNIQQNFQYVKFKYLFSLIWDTYTTDRCRNPIRRNTRAEKLWPTTTGNVNTLGTKIQSGQGNGRHSQPICNTLFFFFFCYLFVNFFLFSHLFFSFTFFSSCMFVLLFLIVHIFFFMSNFFVFLFFNFFFFFRLLFIQKWCIHIFSQISFLIYKFKTRQN